MRGTATVLRDLNRPLFGKTGTTNGPTNVWFVGGTPDIVAGVYLGYDQPRSLGGYAQGGRISAPIWKEWALTALKDQPKVPFVAPPGIRWVRIDRATRQAGLRRVPDQRRPKSPVIWEAFQPQTEQQRSFRSSIGDPYNGEQRQQAIQAWQQQQLQLPAAAAAAAASAAAGTATQPAARAGATSGWLANRKTRSNRAGTPFFRTRA